MKMDYKTQLKGEAFSRFKRKRMWCGFLFFNGFEGFLFPGS